MSGISRKRFRSPSPVGAWKFGNGALPKPITDRLGSALSQWGHLEQVIDALLTAALDAPKIGKVLRDNVRTPKQRLAMLKEMVQASCSIERQGQVLPVLGEFSALSQERALYAHGVWGTADGNPEDAILLMDDTLFIVSFPDIDAIRAGTAPDISERMAENVALVTERDLTRFQDALHRCRTKAEAMVFEIGLASHKRRLHQDTGKG